MHGMAGSCWYHMYSMCRLVQGHGCAQGADSLMLQELQSVLFQLQ
jgi:hypothetical protein